MFTCGHICVRIIYLVSDYPQISIDQSVGLSLHHIYSKVSEFRPLLPTRRIAELLSPVAHLPSLTGPS